MTGGMQAARDDMAGAARRAACHMIKARARHYGRRPGALDARSPGLAAAPPSTLVAVAEHLVARERTSPRRWFGFGGEVTLLNARAALLLGRALRRRAARKDILGQGLAGVDPF